MRFIFSVLLLIIYNVSAFSQQMQIVNDSTYNFANDLQEVVVTAEKRELKPIDIPAALTVITPKKITGENSLDLRNISGVVPNFYMQEGGLKLSTPLYIRGIGTVSGTPPVGLYVDGVPIFDKNAFVFDLYDIRQIEVLRGPQTTLYGRNSINGLINISTNSPHESFSIQAKAGYASYESQSYNLVMNLPFKMVYNKISFSYNKSRGYFKNRYDNYRKSNPSDSYNIRYRGFVDAKHDWKINFGVNYNNSFDGGYAYYVVDSLKERPYEVDYNTPSFYERELLTSHISLQKKWDKMAFNSTTSYSYTKDEQMVDSDFTSLDVFSNNKKSKQNQMTQEFNLQSVKNKRFDWTVGTFGFYKDLTNHYLATFGKDKAYLLPMLLDKSKYYNNTLTWGIAGYGQLTVKELWTGMSLTAGLRYDYEKSELQYNDQLLFSSSSEYEEFHNTEDNKAFKAYLPKFSILQKWNDNLSLYLTVAKGYKAGGYNVIANEMSSQLVELAYNEEELWNYELGVKYFSPNNKFNINAATFFIDWKDQQIFVMGMMGPNIKNAGDAHSLGVEMDLRWEFLTNLSYTLSAGYNKAEYYNHLEKSFEGNRIVMAPEFTANTGLMYHKNVNSSWFRSFSGSTTVNGFGTQYFDEANLLKQDPYFLWNLEFGISGKYLDFSIWGKNILDKGFFTYMLNNPIGGKLPIYNEMGQSGSPARFGASITFKI